jgi:hypothetical protein
VNNLLHQLRQNLAQIELKDAGKIDKFSDIDAPFADLDAGDDGLCGFEPHADLVLRELRGLAP